MSWDGLDDDDRELGYDETTIAPPPFGNWIEPDVTPTPKTPATRTRGKLDSAGVLDDVEKFLSRFVAYPDIHSLVAHTLWIGHTFLMHLWDSTPRIAFLSPEPGSGKTRALEVSEPLVFRAVHAVNVSPAYLFRKVSDPDGLPVILYDEIDTVFGPKAKENEDIRGLLNAGHRKGAISGRVVMRGQAAVLEDFPAFCAVALAGLHELPDTLMTRSVVIAMRRRSFRESIDPYRPRLNEPDAHALRDRLYRWSEQCEFTKWPTMPTQVTDRAADVWEPLLATAAFAGGDWPTRAQQAAIAFVTAGSERLPSLGVMLLEDIRTVIGDHDRMSTSNLLSALKNLEEAPWGDDGRGQELDARGLANRLRPYRIRSRKVRFSGMDQTLQGFLREQFEDAWDRYLPPLSQASGTSGTAGTHAGNDSLQPEQVPDQSNHVPGTNLGIPAHVPHVPDVPDLRGSGERGTTAAPKGSPVPFAPCDVCHTAMVIVEPDQTTHPDCDPAAGEATT